MADCERLRQMMAQIRPLRGLIEAGLASVQDAHEGARWGMLRVGDFLILGGEIDAARGAGVLAGMADDLPPLLYAEGSWRQALAASGVSYSVETRWAFDHHVQPQDDHLRRLLQHMPQDARLVPISGDRIAWCRKQAWTRDFVSQYSDVQYAASGLGVLLEVAGEIVAGASSYVSYPGGIEVQVETAGAHQGRGYATLAAAGLILAGHARGLTVTWDAANEASRRLARKLGYACSGAYEICCVDEK